MTDDEKRVRFHALRKEIEDLETKVVKPLRDQYDKMWQDHEKKLTSLVKKIKEAEKPVFEKKSELGQLARQLRGPDGISRTALPEHK